MRPSCGTSVWYVSSCAKTLRRATTLGARLRGKTSMGCKTPSTRQAMASPSSPGSRCPSLAPAFRAPARTASTSCETYSGCVRPTLGDPLRNCCCSVKDMNSTQKTRTLLILEQRRTTVNVLGNSTDPLIVIEGNWLEFRECEVDFFDGLPSRGRRAH